MIGTLLLQFVVAVFATLAFGIVFQAPVKQLLLCGITGAIGWIVYFVMTVFFETGVVPACLVATIVLTLFARVLAVRREHPVTVYLLTGIFPLVPGAGIYYTAYYLISGDKAMSGAKGLETFEVAAAIVFGIIFGSAIPQVVFKKLFSKRKPQA